MELSSVIQLKVKDVELNLSREEAVELHSLLSKELGVYTFPPVQHPVGPFPAKAPGPYTPVWQWLPEHAPVYYLGDPVPGTVPQWACSTRPSAGTVIDIPEDKPGCIPYWRPPTAG